MIADLNSMVLPLPVLWMNAKHTAVILSQAARGKKQHGDEEEGYFGVAARCKTGCQAAQWQAP